MISTRHAKEFFFAFSSVLAKTGTPILILFVSANRLDINEFAIIAFGILIFNLAQVVLDLGYQLRLPKMIARGRPDFVRWFGITLGLKVVISIMLVGILGLVFWFLLEERERVVAIGFLIAGVFSSIAQHFLYVLRGSFKFMREAATLLATELLTLIIVFAYCGQDWTAGNVAFSFLISKGFQSLVSATVVWSIVRPVKLTIQSRELRATIPYSIQTIVGAGFLLVDGVIVKGLVNSVDFSMHQMFVRLIIVGCFLLGPVQILLVSYFSKIISRDPRRIPGYLWATTGLLSVSSAVFLGIYWFFDEVLVEFVLGSEFHVLTSFSWLLVTITFLRYICIPFGILLSASDGQIRRAKILGAAFLFLVILNFMLVPEFGILGSFYASLIAHAALGVAYVTMAVGCVHRLKYGTHD